MQELNAKIDADLKTACGNLAHDLGASGDFGSGQDACKAAAKAIGDAKAKLGDMIFDEKRTSSDNSIACNTCHSPRNGFTTHTKTSKGIGDQLGGRNAPSILNAMFYKAMFWDGAPRASRSKRRCRF